MIARNLRPPKESEWIGPENPTGYYPVPKFEGFLGEFFDETVGWIQSWYYGFQYFPSKLPIICGTWWLSNKNGSAKNWIHPWIYQTVFRLPVASCRFLDCFKMVLSLAEFFGCLNPSIETSHHSCDENQRRNPRKLHEPKEPKMIIVFMSISN